MISGFPPVSGLNIPQAFRVLQKLQRIFGNFRGWRTYSQHYETIFYRSYKPSNVEPTFDLDEFSFTSQDTLKTRVKRFLQRNSKMIQMWSFVQKHENSIE